jgi:hypothetical protein
MTKRKTLAITLTAAALFVIAVTAIIVKSGLLEKEEITVEFTDLPAPKEENSEISNENMVLTVDSVLESVGSIVKWEGDEYSRATILWNTESEELKLEGKGYLFGDIIGSKVLKEKHDTLKVFLRNAGFEHDRYNVTNGAPGYERIILKLNDVGCELYVRDDERKGSTDMGLLCTKLPGEVVNREPTPMSEKIARSIAETSECVDYGVLKENAFYNENSKTWWIDLDAAKTECNPACVIFEDESVEINWRCTGLTP